MPIEKCPKIVLPPNYVPPGGIPYKVKTGDNLQSVARAHGITEQQLEEFNFHTTHPAEINWYLRRNVGCVRPTHDTKNWIFTSEARPGIIYLPPKIAVPAVPQPPEANRTNTWFGIGGKVGTQFVVDGIETLAGYVASLDDLGKGMAIGASINRLGPGFGASGGACFIYISGVSSPEKLNGHQEGGWDFNVALGEKWDTVAKSTKKIKKLEPLIKVITKIGAKTPSALKQALKADPDEWVELLKAGKSVKEYLEINPKGEPNVFVFDVPWLGAGTEVSLFYGVANFSALWDCT